MKILALDFGTHAIKAVTLDVTFGRVELGDDFSEPVIEPEAKAKSEEPEENPDEPATKKKKAAPPRTILTEGQKHALKKLAAEHPLAWERLVVNIPRAWVTTRLVTLPTRDRKTIQSSLGFELEDEIPFTTEQMIMDFAILHTQGSQSTVYAALALRHDIQMFLQELQMLGFDPDLVTVDSWSVSNLLKKALPEDLQGKPVCVVNIGAAQTAINIFLGTDPILTHVSTTGGDAVTRAIAASYHLPLSDAERAKVEGAFLLTQTHLQTHQDITAEQKQFSGVVEDALAPLVRELKQVLIAYRNANNHMVKRIYVTGGSGQIPNLPLWLEEQLQVPVVPFTYMSRVVGQSLQLSEATEARIAGAVGLGLAAVRPDKHTTINLRKDEFEKHGGGIAALSLKQYRKFFVYAAASLAFIYLNLIVQYAVLSSRSDKQEAALERAIKGVLGAVSSSNLHTYASSPTALKSAVDKELAKYKENRVANVKPEISSFDLLNKVSAVMPQDITLDSTLFEVKDGRLKLTGAIESTASADRVGKALEDTHLLAEINKIKVDEDKKAKVFRFEYSAKVADTTQTPAGGSNVKTR